MKTLRPALYYEMTNWAHTPRMRTDRTQSQAQVGVATPAFAHFGARLVSQRLG